LLHPLLILGLRLWLIPACVAPPPPTHPPIFPFARVQDNLPKPKRAAPAAQKKADLLKQAALVSEQNRERMRALQPVGGGGGTGGINRSSHMDDDSDSSDDGVWLWVCVCASG
jgi:hypothetical protein